eukprot:m.87205 g.87205  ORF g.87205 m.87205 type:complete len:152 (+) comp14496_c0_seq2:45-500(+)
MGDSPVKAELVGAVVKGFGRGSKELGIPTANFPEDVVDNLPESVTQGIYYGWAQVDKGEVYKAVMSVGWNPFYNNTKRSAEVHIMHEFPSDFYGSQLRMLVLGYIRPEQNFSSLDELIAAINNDIAMANSELEKKELAELRHSPFFIQSSL